jgi:hypothetical protein
MCKQYSNRELVPVIDVTVYGDTLTQTIARSYMLSAMLEFDLNLSAFEVLCAESR